MFFKIYIPHPYFQIDVNGGSSLGKSDFSGITSSGILCRSEGGLLLGISGGGGSAWAAWTLANGGGFSSADRNLASFKG